MLPLVCSEVADKDLQLRVTQFLATRGSVFRTVMIHVNSGDVTLDGYVDNWHEKERAYNFCRRVAGVMRVINHIRCP